MPLVGPVGRTNRGRLAPLGGVERPRRVVRFARLIHRRVRASWRTFGPRRLRRQSDADHIVTQRGDRSIDGVSTQARSGGLRWASVTQNALRFRLLGFEAGQEVRMPNWNWSSVEMRASSAARSGRPEPGSRCLAARRGGTGKSDAQVARRGWALSAPVAAADAG